MKALAPRRAPIALAVVVAIVAGSLHALAPAQAGEHAAVRSLGGELVGPGAEVMVTVAVHDFGPFARVSETLPEGWEYAGSSLPRAAVSVQDRTVRFLVLDLLLRNQAFAYWVRAPDTAGTFAFSGMIEDSDRVTAEVTGERWIAVFPGIGEEGVACLRDPVRSDNYGAATSPVYWRDTGTTPMLSFPSSTQEISGARSRGGSGSIDLNRIAASVAPERKSRSRGYYLSTRVYRLAEQGPTTQPERGAARWIVAADGTCHKVARSSPLVLVKLWHVYQRRATGVSAIERLGGPFHPRPTNELTEPVTVCLTDPAAEPAAIAVRLSPERAWTVLESSRADGRLCAETVRVGWLMLVHDPLPAEGPFPGEIEDAARTLLAAELDVDPQDLKLDRTEAVNWSDASLGCQPEGESHRQVITPGFQIVFQLAGTAHAVHSKADGSRLVVCGDGS